MRSFQLLALALVAPSVCQAMVNPTKTLIVSLSSHVRKGPFLLSPQTSFLSLPRGGGGNLALSPETVQMAETLAPKIGILTSTALYFAPAAAVLSAIQSDDIGDLNPLPLAIMSIVSVAWLAYGLVEVRTFCSLLLICTAPKTSQCEERYCDHICRQD